MGPCVRLIQILSSPRASRRDSREEENQKQWAEFKTAAKSDPWILTEQKIATPINSEKSIKSRSFCFYGGQFCANVKLHKLNPIIDDDKALAGTATLTYEDGSTENAEVHHKYWGPVVRGSHIETTILTATKEMRLSTGGCGNIWTCSTEGTSITNNSDGSKRLADVRKCDSPRCNGLF